MRNIYFILFNARCPQRKQKKSASKRGREVLSLSEDQLQLVADKVARQLQGQLPAKSSAPSVVLQNNVSITPSSSMI